MFYSLITTLKYNSFVYKKIPNNCELTKKELRHNVDLLCLSSFLYFYCTKSPFKINLCLPVFLGVHVINVIVGVSVGSRT